MKALQRGLGTQTFCSHHHHHHHHHGHHHQHLHHHHHGGHHLCHYHIVYVTTISLIFCLPTCVMSTEHSVGLRVARPTLSKFLFFSLSKFFNQVKRVHTHTHTHTPLLLGHFLWPNNSVPHNFENVFGERKVSHPPQVLWNLFSPPSTRRLKENSLHVWLLGHPREKLPSEITPLGSLMGHSNRRGLVRGILFTYCWHYCQPSLCRVATGQGLGRT